MIADLQEPLVDSCLVLGIALFRSFHVIWNLERLGSLEVRSWHWKFSRSCVFIKFFIIKAVFRVLWKCSSVLNHLIVILDRFQIEYLRQVVLNQNDHFVHQELLKLVNHAPLSKICLFFTLQLGQQKEHRPTIDVSSLYELAFCVEDFAFWSFPVEQNLFVIERVK